MSLLFYPMPGSVLPTSSITWLQSFCPSPRPLGLPQSGPLLPKGECSASHLKFPTLPPCSPLGSHPATPTPCPYHTLPHPCLTPASPLPYPAILSLLDCSFHYGDILSHLACGPTSASVFTHMYVLGQACACRCPCPCVWRSEDNSDVIPQVPPHFVF